MPTPVFVCGAECGIAARGTLSAGTEHWSAASANISVVTSGPSSMRSTRCFRVNTSAAGAINTHTYAAAIGSPATHVARFYINFATLPNADCMIFRSGGADILGLRWDNATSTLRAGNSSGAQASGGFTPSTGQWYRIDLKIVHNTSGTVDLQVDGVAQTQYSATLTASTAANFDIGVANGTPTADFYIDDIITSGTSGDYPIGAGTIVGLYPTGDRTNSAANPTDGNFGHFYSAVNDFKDGAGGGDNLAAQNVETDTWLSLQNPLSTTIPTNWITNSTGATTEHLVWTKTSLPGDASSINGVMMVCTSHSSGTTANSFQAGISDASGNFAGLFQVDLSESTITVPVAVRTTAPDGSAWTTANLNAAFLYFGDSTDVNPDPFLDGICIEVDYVQAAAATSLPHLPFLRRSFRTLLVR